MKRSIFTLLVWAVLAFLLSFSGILARIPGPAPQVLCALFIWAGIKSMPADALSAKALTMFQSWRLLPAVAFLMMARSGALPRPFALEAGWGDLVIAVTAPLAALAITGAPGVARWWQFAGIADLALVVGGAAVFTALGDPRMVRLKEFPMGMLPLFLVPLSIVAHILALRAIRKPIVRAAEAAP